jgi:hypothetical protein
MFHEFISGREPTPEPSPAREPVARVTTSSEPNPARERLASCIHYARRAGARLRAGVLAIHTAEQRVKRAQRASDAEELAQAVAAREELPEEDALVHTLALQNEHVRQAALDVLRSDPERIHALIRAYWDAQHAMQSLAQALKWVEDMECLPKDAKGWFAQGLRAYQSIHNPNAELPHLLQWKGALNALHEDAHVPLPEV